MSNEAVEAAKDAIGNAAFLDQGNGRFYVDVGKISPHIAQTIMDALDAQLSRQQSAQQNSSGPSFASPKGADTVGQIARTDATESRAVEYTDGSLSREIEEIPAQSTGAGVDLEAIRREVWENVGLDGNEEENLKRTIDYLASQKLIGGGWRTIESAPDGQGIVTISPIAMSEGKYFEPVIAYRNGDYWFHAPGDRLLLKPTHWQPLPSPPASTGERGE